MHWLYGGLFLSCLLGARARTSSKKETTAIQPVHRYTASDDSGSKLRDKEQQRLSSK